MEWFFHLGHFSLGIIGIAISASVGYSAATYWGEWAEHRTRLMLIMLIGGLLLYNYLALDLPGSQSFLDALGAMAGFVFGLVGSGLGLVAAYLWARYEDRT